jgi:hypothetical protein
VQWGAARVFLLQVTVNGQDCIAAYYAASGSQLVQRLQLGSRESHQGDVEFVKTTFR